MKTNDIIRQTTPAIWVRMITVILLLTIASLYPTIAAGADSEKEIDPPPGACEILNDNGIAEFPFELYRGDIRFQCEVNGRQVHLLLDDGYLWDQLLFWGGPAVDSLGLKYDGEAGLGKDGSDKLMSKTASGITVSFPGVEFSEQSAVVTPSSSGNATMWSGSVGQISAGLFKHFVVDMNFDKMMITLIDPEKFEYHGGGVGVPWEPLGDGPRSIPATLKLADGRDVPMKLFMDLGYNEQLLLVTAGEHNITAPDKKLPASLGFNIQRVETRGFIGRLPQIDIGGYQLSDPVVSYVAEECNDHTVAEAMIGLGVLSRFNLVFDYYGQLLYFEPNNSFEDPYEYSMTGFTLGRPLNGSREITIIHKNSPAEEAGLLVGDRVTAINGKAIDKYDIFDLFPMFKREGSVIDMVIKRGGEAREVSIKLRRLI